MVDQYRRIGIGKAIDYFNAVRMPHRSQTAAVGHPGGAARRRC
jgi:hypothetical protein